MHLNLPTYQIKITKQLNKPFIYDEIRKKYVSLTPEEWVRQHILNYLLNHKKLSKALKGKKHSIEHCGAMTNRSVEIVDCTISL